jgi:hypothetical protein
MAATLTKVAGPCSIGSMKIATYTMLFDSSYPTGGEAIDLTGEFDYVYQVICGANDTAADNAKTYRAIFPGASTAITSSNVLIQAHWSADGTDGEDFVEFTNTGDLSAVGSLCITVIGK